MVKRGCPDLPELLRVIAKFLGEVKVPPPQQKQHAEAVKAFNQTLAIFYPRELKVARCGPMAMVPKFLNEETGQKVTPPPKTSLT